MTTRQEIESKVAAFAAAQIPPITVAYENVPFTRPTGVPWLEVVIASAGTITTTVDALGTRERGTIGVNVYVPSGQGVGKADALAALVVKIFPVIPKVGTVSIEGAGNTGQFKLTNDGWGCIPVSFPYRVEGSVA